MFWGDLLIGGVTLFFLATAWRGTGASGPHVAWRRSPPEASLVGGGEDRDSLEQGGGGVYPTPPFSFCLWWKSVPNREDALFGTDAYSYTIQYTSVHPQNGKLTPNVNTLHNIDLPHDEKAPFDVQSRAGLDEGLITLSCIQGRALYCASLQLAFISRGNKKEKQRQKFVQAPGQLTSTPAKNHRR